MISRAPINTGGITVTLGQRPTRIGILTQTLLMSRTLKNKSSIAWRMPAPRSHRISDRGTWHMKLGKFWAPACIALLLLLNLAAGPATDAARAAYEKGMSLFDKANYDAAIACYTEAIRLDPTFAEAFCNRGRAYNRKHNFEKAVADCTEAIRLNPHDARAFNSRGFAYVELGDYDRAIADHTAGIRINPKNANTYESRSFVYAKKGAFDNAIADCTEAIRLNPNDAIAYRYRGSAYRAKGNFNNAIADYTTAIRLNPKDALAYEFRGHAYVAKHVFDGAVADYTDAIRLNPKNAKAYENRGRTYQYLGNFNNAIADLSEAIRLAPNDADVYFARGTIHKNRGDSSQANEDFEQFRRCRLEALLHELGLASAQELPNADLQELERRIEEQVKSLKYDDKVARDVAMLVRNWDLVALSRKLATARMNHQRGQLSLPQLVAIERDVAETLARIIESVILPDDAPDKGHELTDVIYDKSGCCQGMALLYNVLGNSIGLRVGGLEVIEMAGGSRSGSAGSGGKLHDACLVQLPGDLVSFADVTRNLGGRSLVSKPFRFGDYYRLRGSYWELKDDSNPLGLHRVVRPVDPSGLLSQLFCFRGYADGLKGDLAKAIVDCNEAVRLDRKNSTAYGLRVLAEQGFDCMAFCGTRLDDPTESMIQVSLRGRKIIYDVRKAKIGAYDGRLIFVLEGRIPVTLFDNGSTRGGWLGPQEVNAFLAGCDIFLRKNRPDLVVTYGGDAASIAVQHVAKRLGIPIVFWLHNFAYTERSAFEAVDYVIVPSEFSRRYHRERLGLDCHVLPNVVNWEAAEVKDRMGRAGDGVMGRAYVTFINPHAVKGVYVFARIARELARRRPDIPVLVTQGRSRNDALLNPDLGLAPHVLAQFPIEPTCDGRNITTMPFTPDPGRFYPAVYSVTKLLLMPSLWYESFGLVAAESMLNGIPVLASNRGGLPETIGDAGLLFDIPARYTPETRDIPTVEEVEPWVETIIRLWDDEAEYERRSRAARERAQQWHPDRVGPIYREFFRNITHQPGPPLVPLNVVTGEIQNAAAAT
jgi:tetratricopeptide (TPR) repeat protein